MKNYSEQFSELVTIAKYGSPIEKNLALNKLGDITSKAGDFEKLDLIITEFKSILPENYEDKYISLASENFFRKIPVNPIYSHEIELITNSLIMYITSSRMPNKKDAKELYPLFAILNAYHELTDRSDAIYPSDYGADSRLFRNEFGDVLNVIKLLGSIQEKKGVSPAFIPPADLKEGLDVDKYLRQLDDKNFYRYQTESRAVKTLQQTKISFGTASDLASKAKKGHIATLETDLQHIDNNSSEYKFIKALQPYATLIFVAKEFDAEQLRNYKPHTEFEKNSEIYQSLEKFAPLFALEKIRCDINAGNNVSKEDANYLFSAREIASSTVKQFTNMVRQNYIASLVKNNELQI